MKKIAISFFAVLYCSLSYGQITVRAVSPITVNDRVNSFRDNHIVMHNPTHKSPKDKLVVCLTPAGIVPSQMQVFDSFAAQQGFHVIGLSYSNAPMANDVCGNHADSECHKKVRQEVLEANGYTDYVQVDSNNGIDQRLSQLIGYLHSTYGSENWGQFNRSLSEPNWAKIVVVGYAEAASQALFIANTREVERAICLAAKPDEYKGQYAGWQSSNYTTAISKLYFFHQEADSSVQDTAYFRFSKQIDGDKQAVIELHADEDFHFSRVLNTTFITDFKKEIVALDAHTPINKDNTPRFAPAWQYMLFNNATSSLNELKVDAKVYPNPAKESLTIDLPQLQNWVLFDVQGKQIESGIEKELDVSHLLDGYYVLKMTSSVGFFVKKIRIQRQ